MIIRFNIGGIDFRRESIESVSPSFLDISFNGLRTFKILNIFILSKMPPKLNKPTKEKMTIVRSNLFEWFLR